MATNRLSRRAFLRWGAVAGTGAVLAACATPTPQIIKETVVVKETVPVEKVVEKTVKETVVVEKTVPVEKVVTKEVEKVVVATPQPKAPVTIGWWQNDPAEMQEAYIKMTEAFNAKGLGIKAEVKYIPGDGYEDKLNTMIAAGDGPDVWMWFYAVEIARHGQFQNLTPYLQRDKIDPMKLWFPICSTRTVWEGSMFGTPREVAYASLAYNKDLFDEFGVKYPQEGWTLEDFVETSLKLTDPTKKTWGTQIGGPGALLWDSALPWNLEFKLTSEDGHQTVGFMDSPESIEAYQWVIDLEDKHKVSIPSQEQQALGGWPFASGKIGTGVISCWGVKDIKALKFNWGAVSAPMKKGGTSYTWGDSVGYWMWSGCRKKEEAWEFMKFISGPEGSLIPHQLGWWTSPCPEVWLKLGADKDPILGRFWEQSKLPTRVINYARSEHQWTCIHPAHEANFTLYIQEKQRPLDKIVKAQAKSAQECLDKAYAAS